MCGKKRGPAARVYSPWVAPPACSRRRCWPGRKSSRSASFWPLPRPGRTYCGRSWCSGTGAGTSNNNASGRSRSSRRHCCSWRCPGRDGGAEMRWRIRFWAANNTFRPSSRCYTAPPPPNSRHQDGPVRSLLFTDAAPRSFSHTHTLTVLASRPTPYRLAARSRAQRINSLSSPNRLKNQDCQPLREESKFEDALVRSLARFSLGKQVMPLTLEGLPPLNSKIAHGIMQRDVKYTPTRPHSLGDTGKNTFALNTRSNLFEYFTAQFFS
jgi:hypothetical protein